MTPVIAFLLLSMATAVCAVTGVALVFGVGWAFITAAAAFAFAAALVRRGLKADG